MIIAEITPGAQKITKVSPFSSTTETLNYMTALARPYIPGGKVNNFQVRYGSVEKNEEGEIVRFDEHESQRLELTSEDLKTWGTNDETLLEIIASKLGLSVKNYHNI